jgi:DNA-directed RNA polymerase specialized sigma24 family protein
MQCDEQLMLQACNGDTASFEELVLRHQHRLIQLMRDLTGRPDKCEEFAQAVLLGLYRTRMVYDARDSFSDWLMGIAYRTAASAGRP